MGVPRLVAIAKKLTAIRRPFARTMASAASAGLKEVEYHSHDFDHEELIEAGQERLTELQRVAMVSASAASDAVRSLKSWQNFHHKNKGAFFHPRSYITAAFPELRCESVEALQTMLTKGAIPAAGTEEEGRGRARQTPLTIMELGVGNGSNLFALSSANPQARLFASDFSRGALKFVRDAARRHAKEAEAEVEAAVAAGAGAEEARPPPPSSFPPSAFQVFSWDVVTGAPPPPSRAPSPSAASSAETGGGAEDWDRQPPDAIMKGGCDAVLMTFVLSAVAPQHHLQALRNVHALLKNEDKGPRGRGLLCFRDYGRFDCAQLRAKPENVVEGSGGNLHLRGDGTLAFYFDLKETRALLEEAGFEVLELEYCTVKSTNRKLGLEMKRVFLNGKAVPRVEKDGTGLKR